MCIVEALRVVEAVTSGKDSRNCLPWRSLDKHEVRFLATRGKMPSRPSICEDRQWELVKRMCELEPRARIKIAAVVDELAKLAFGSTTQDENPSCASPISAADLKSIESKFAAAQTLLVRLQSEPDPEELTSVLRLYFALWNRLEQTYGRIDDQWSEEYRVMFCTLVAEADKATAKLQDAVLDPISLAEALLHCYAFGRRLDNILDATSRQGDLNLMWAAKSGRIEVVQSLIEKGGADVNVQSEDGYTTAMIAAESGRIEIVRYLVEHGASINASDNVGNTALTLAAERGHLEVFEYVAGQPGVDIHAKNEYGITVLMRAAAHGQLNIVQYLAGQGDSNLNATNNDGCTALMMATLSGHVDVVQCLAEEHGADVTINTRGGDTALMMAAVGGHADLFRYFTERHGADVNAKNAIGDSALMMAAESGRIVIVRYLTELGVDVNAKNERGSTALMKASTNGHIKVVQCLLEQRGINVATRNQRGETAIRLATDHGHQEIRRLLTPFLPPRPRQDGPETISVDNYSIHPTEVEFIRFCQSGGIGGEYRAKWLDADAVVKLFISNASQTLFHDEVHLWQPLRHPNVMKMYGACNASPHLQFFVCEYVSNGSLIEHVELASVKRPTTWKFLYEAALGLEYLHERGIFHGDLRCSNILIGSDNLAKLSNFGLSSTKCSGRGLSGVVASMRWQAPESLKGTPPSGASDIYSLGMCILEAATRAKPWNCESERTVVKYKKRWIPELGSYSFSEPDCPPGDVRRLVWKMCCQNPLERAKLPSVLYELEQLAIAECSSSSLPEHEPDVDCSKVNKLWLEVKTFMTTCGDAQYHRPFNNLKRVRKVMKDSISGLKLPIQFDALLNDFYRIINMSPEQASISRLSSTLATTRNMTALCGRIESVLAAIDNTTDMVNTRSAQWQQQRTEQIEAFVSGVADTSLLLQSLKSQEERAVFLRTLKTEIEDVQSQYTPAQLGMVKKAYDTIASTIGSEDLAKLTPEWFIPWYELIVDEWRCLGKGGFGCVYQAKWLDSDVVAKIIGSNSKHDIFSLKSSLFRLSALIDHSTTQSLMDSTKRGAGMEMFRHEVDVWFRLNHPHIIRLFGACHVGRPFFVCEYATNGTLVRYLNTHPEELWVKLHEAALGVQYLHARGVVHGDLKGINIVIGSDKKAKVTDFGLSSIAGNEDRPQISGAWQWVAPECLPAAKNTATNPGSRNPTCESDIYSLGMCIMEALRVVENVERVKAGKESQSCLPWRGLEDNVVKLRATHGELPSQPTICSDEQWVLVKQMCAYKPKERMKISTVVRRLAWLAHIDQRKPASVLPKSSSVDSVIAAAKYFLTRLQREEDQVQGLISLYGLLWKRLEQTYVQINEEQSDECRTAFITLVGEADEATSKLKGTLESLTVLAEMTMRCYALDRRLEKFCDEYFLLLNRVQDDLKSQIYMSGMNLTTLSMPLPFVMCLLACWVSWALA